ncbi:MAG: response regulator [Cytobacillus gottheilii]|uniref:response regulator n=1 Tax=Cytobacillus gottheilii TaxID=859144 RepID=UPI00346471ED
MKAIIVEDDPMVSDINHQYLERFEFEIIASVKSIPELWNILNKQIPDLILLDVYLYGETGIDFLHDIRQKGISIPIIMITAAHDMATIKKALDFGVIDFLIKPFTYKRFSLAIEKFFQYHDLFTKHKKTDQAMLDQILIGDGEITSHTAGYQNIGPPSLPKGVSRLTMKKVLAAMKEYNETFSTDDIAKQVGLSRISTKKYLQFLTEIGYLTEELKYLTVGRPITVFSINFDREHLILPYK